MTRKQTRLTIILASLAAGLGIAAGLVLYAIATPSCFSTHRRKSLRKALAPARALRLGGLVEQGSLAKEGNDAKFVVTRYCGHHQGVLHRSIARPVSRRAGRCGRRCLRVPDGVFVADTVLAKHDENYMPKDVADKLKEKGVWQEGVKTQ